MSSKALRRIATVAATSAVVAVGGALTTGAAASAAPDWDKLAQCESGGNWAINTGNSYYGGVQFSLQTWRAFGGSGMPHQASKAEQIRIAEKVLAVQGAGAWPGCTKKTGWANGGGKTVESPVKKKVVEQATKAAPTKKAPSQVTKKTAAVPTATGTYTVILGDTLSEIAAKSGSSWQRLAQLNKIVNPNLIFPDQVIKIG